MKIKPKRIDTKQKRRTQYNTRARTNIMILNTLRKSVGRGNTTLARNNYKAFTSFRPENKTFSLDLQEEIKDTRMNAKMRHFSTTTKDSEGSGMTSRQLSRSSSPFVRSLSRSDSFIENQPKQRRSVKIKARLVEKLVWDNACYLVK